MPLETDIRDPRPRQLSAYEDRAGDGLVYPRGPEDPPNAMVRTPARRPMPLATFLELMGGRRTRYKNTSDRRLRFTMFHSIELGLQHGGFSGDVLIEVEPHGEIEIPDAICPHQVHPNGSCILFTAAPQLQAVSGRLAAVPFHGSLLPEGQA